MAQNRCKFAVNAALKVCAFVPLIVNLKEHFLHRQDAGPMLWSPGRQVRAAKIVTSPIVRTRGRTGTRRRRRQLSPRRRTCTGCGQNWKRRRSGESLRQSPKRPWLAKTKSTQPFAISLLAKIWQEGGGRGGIRTHGTVARTSDFESGAFNHSATLPSFER